MAKDRAAAAQGLATLLQKLNDPDPDIRFMQLSDLSNILVASASSYISNDTHTAARVVEGLLKSLSDQHGEVQNQALKWYIRQDSNYSSVLNSSAWDRWQLACQEKSFHPSSKSSRT